MAMNTIDRARIPGVMNCRYVIIAGRYRTYLAQCFAEDPEPEDRLNGAGDELGRIVEESADLPFPP